MLDEGGGLQMEGGGQVGTMVATQQGGQVTVPAWPQATPWAERHFILLVGGGGLHELSNEK